MTDQTRGERNNNPGNINFVASIQYVGQLGVENVPPGETYKPRFARFDTPDNGVRALCVCLLAYYRRHGLDTVAGIINRWSPRSDDNATLAYINAVSKDLGVKPADVILLSDAGTLGKLATSIIRQENSRVPYPSAMIAACVARALASTTVPAVERAGPPAPKSVAVPPRVAGIPGPQPTAPMVLTPAPSVWAWCWGAIFDSLKRKKS
jgi:hypothetical protein